MEEGLSGLSVLLEKGILGIFLAGSLWVNWMFYKEIRSGEKERRAETKADSDRAWAALNATAATGQAQAGAMLQLKEVVETAILKGGRT